MAVANIEVYRDGGQWRWRVIAPCGRPLVVSPTVFFCDISAMTAAKAWRANWTRVAEAVDGKVR